MIILRYITITLNIVFLVILAFFLRDLRWDDVNQRPSIIGFGWMALLFVMNIFLIAML